MAIPETMGERVRVALHAAGLNATRASKVLGVGRYTVSRWLNGDDIPERELVRIAEITGKNCPWLRYGLLYAREQGEEAYRKGFGDALAKARVLLSQLE